MHASCYRIRRAPWHSACAKCCSVVVSTVLPKAGLLAIVLSREGISVPHTEHLRGPFPSLCQNSVLWTHADLTPADRIIGRAPTSLQFRILETASRFCSASQLRATPRSDSLRVPRMRIMALQHEPSCDLQAAATAHAQIASCSPARAPIASCDNKCFHRDVINP